MLQHAASPDASRRSKWLIAALVCALIPLQLVAGPPAVQEPPAQAPSAAEAPRAAAPGLPAPPEGPAPPATTPVGPLPAETAPTPATGDAGARVRDLADTIQQAEQKFVNLVRQQQDAEAMRQKATELALILQARQEATEQASREETQGLMEAYNRRIQELLESLAAQNDRARVEQASRESQERTLDQLARRQQTSEFLNEQLAHLNGQVEMLVRQIQQIAEHQEQLAAAQRRLSDQNEQVRRLVEEIERMRKAIEAK